MKACAAVSVDQILQLAGVAAFTATADQLHETSQMTGPAPESVFFKGDAPAKGIKEGKEVNGQENGHANSDANGVIANGNEQKKKTTKFVDDESGFRLAFAKADGGMGQLKTAQVGLCSSLFLSTYFRGPCHVKEPSETNQPLFTQALNLFSEYRLKAESMMRVADMTNIG